jgi:hypothetical protein
MGEGKFDLAFRNKIAELSLYGDSVLVVYYAGSREHQLCITAYMKKAIEAANQNQGFPVALWRDGVKVMSEYYNGQTRLFFNGITHEDLEAYFKIPKYII